MTKPTKDVRVLNPPERRRFVLELYCELESLGQPRPGYSRFHALVKRVQERLEGSYRVSLGYAFDAENCLGPWDDVLQRDLELLDIQSLVDNHDRLALDGKEIYTHELGPTSAGRQVSASFSGRHAAEFYGVSREEIRGVVDQVVAPK